MCCHYHILSLSCVYFLLYHVLVLHFENLQVGDYNERLRGLLIFWSSSDTKETADILSLDKATKALKQESGRF